MGRHGESVLHSFRQLILITLVATVVTLGVNLALLRHLGWQDLSSVL